MDCAAAPATPVVSVVTVTLNAGADLLATARTVDEQDYPAFEHLVKDGGSTDGSVEHLVCAPYRRVVRAPDGGIFPAMNQALTECRGRYVLFLNAGDGLAGPGVLRAVADQAAAADWPEVIYTHFLNQRYALQIEYPPALNRAFLYRLSVVHQACYIRRDCFERYGRFDAGQYPILADGDLLLRLLIRHRARAVLCPMAGCYYKGEGASTQPSRQRAKYREEDRLRATYFTRWERWLWGTVHRLMGGRWRAALLHRYPQGPLQSLYYGLWRRARKRVWLRAARSPRGAAAPH